MGLREGGEEREGGSWELAGKRRTGRCSLVLHMQPKHAGGKRRQGIHRIRNTTSVVSRKAVGENLNRPCRLPMLAEVPTGFQRKAHNDAGFQKRGLHPTLRLNANPQNFPSAFAGAGGSRHPWQSASVVWLGTLGWGGLWRQLRYLTAIHHRLHRSSAAASFILEVSSSTPTSGHCCLFCSTKAGMKATPRAESVYHGQH